MSDGLHGAQPNMTLGLLSEVLDAARRLGADDDTLIVLARDAEGNGFSPLAGYDAEVYEPSSTYSGDLIHWDEDDVDDLGIDRQDFEEWQADALARGARKCIVLWPTN